VVLYLNDTINNGTAEEYCTVVEGIGVYRQDDGVGMDTISWYLKFGK
jgi:hypothetical protein